MGHKGYNLEGNHIPNHIKRKFDGYLKYEIVLRKKSLQELIAELNHLKNITVQFKAYVPPISLHCVNYNIYFGLGDIILLAG